MVVKISKAKPTAPEKVALSKTHKINQPNHDQEEVQLAVVGTEKTITQPKLDLDTQSASLKELADQYGKLSDEVEALKLNPAFVNLEAVKKQLLERVNSEYQLSDSLVLSGDHYDVDISAGAKEARKIEDLEAVLKMVGHDTFMKLVKIGITDANKYLTGEQIEKVASTPGLTKTRKIVAKFKG